jgi:hypothetical protein
MTNESQDKYLIEYDRTYATAIKNQISEECARKTREELIQSKDKKSFLEDLAGALAMNEWLKRMGAK